MAEQYVEIAGVKFMIEYTGDNCPNNCGYCRALGLACVYSEKDYSGGKNGEE